VKVDGIDLIPSIVDVAELFSRQLKFSDFDVSEMSMSTLMMINSQGNTALWARGIVEHEFGVSPRGQFCVGDAIARFPRKQAFDFASYFFGLCLIWRLIDWTKTNNASKAQL
jgi:hypothetical protein